MSNTKFSLRNQTEELSEFTDNDIIEFLNTIYEDWDEFIVLSAEDEAIDNISFVQAIWNDDMLHMEIGVKIEGKIKLTMYERNMTMEEGEKIFLDFAHGKWSGNLDEFSLCECQP